MKTYINPYLGLSVNAAALSEVSGRIHLLINRLVVGHNVPNNEAELTSVQLRNVVDALELMHAELSSEYDSDKKEEAGKTTAPRVEETDSGIGAAQT